MRRTAQIGQAFSLKPTLGFGEIEADRIERRSLVKETFLRRHRYRIPAVEQQDRLPQLQVPVAQRQFLALEGRDGEIRALDIREHLAGLAGAASDASLADHAN